MVGVFPAMQFARFRGILDGLFAATKSLVEARRQHPRGPRRAGQGRLEANGFGKVGQGRLVLPLADVGDASILVGGNFCRVEANRLICDRPERRRALRFGSVRRRGCCEQRRFVIEPDGFVAVGHASFDISLADPGDAAETQHRRAKLRLGRIVQLDFQGLVAIRARFLELPQTQPHTAPIAKRVSLVGFQLDRSVQVGECVFELAFLRPGKSAIIPRLIQLRIDAERSVMSAIARSNSPFLNQTRPRLL